MDKPLTHTSSPGDETMSYEIPSRFQIEDVEEHPHSGDHQFSITTPGDTTITSFGYNTAEAVPMTVYYRHAAEDDGRNRPSLDYLHEGRMPALQEPREGEVCSQSIGMCAPSGYQQGICTLWQHVSRVLKGSVIRWGV